MKKFIIVGFVIILIAGVIWAGSFYNKNLKGAGPAFGPIPTITPQPKESVNTTGLPLTIPKGYTMSIYAKNIPDARVLIWDPEGRLLISSPATGKVFLVNADGSSSVVVSGLNRPHGLAFYNGKLYIAETNAVAIYDYNGTATNRKKIIDLPGGGNHFSRTIAFGPDKKLYISIGSTCNVCKEQDSRRASILVANPDGSDLRSFATGLRNAVFFTWQKGQMYATDMGRDLLGDNIPPDTIDIIKDGKNYGWPYCYGKQIPDTSFGGTTEICKTTEPSYIDLPAHSAPLGLAFKGSDLFVAYHGSWNRSVPTGYKIVRIRNGEISDFVTGWLTDKGALGRPVDLLFDKQGNLFVSDDKAGVIYKLSQ